MEILFFCQIKALLIESKINKKDMDFICRIPSIQIRFIRFHFTFGDN